MITGNEFRIYEKVKRELLAEDAKIFVKDFLAEKRDCNPWDIEDDEISGYNFDYLADEYLDKESGDLAPNDIWNSVIEDFFGDNEVSDEEEDY